MLALLTEDATWSMPPMPTWYRGHDAIERSWPTRRSGSSGATVRARERPARGRRVPREAATRFLAYALDVLDLRGDRIASIVSFIGGERFPAFGLPPAISD